MWRLSVIVVSFSLFIGCGFKGPLYMPISQEKPAVVKKKTKINASQINSYNPQRAITNESSNQTIKLPN